MVVVVIFDDGVERAVSCCCDFEVGLERCCRDSDASSDFLSRSGD